jgi:Cys-tRNA(Pro)/Cys-tRNA(Cys) deacylase
MPTMAVNNPAAEAREGGGMAKSPHVKTNAMRALDARKIPYDTYTYPSTIHSADEVAPLLGVPASEVYKTLVMLADDGRHLLVAVPGDAEADLRLLARSLGVKSVRMAPQREAERLTGLLVGGISPLALLGKPFEVFVDARAADLERLYINGGQRGVNLRLRVADLLAVTGARLIAATHPPSPKP